MKRVSVVTLQVLSWLQNLGLIPDQEGVVEAWLNLFPDLRHIEHAILVGVSYEFIIRGKFMVSVDSEQPLVKDDDTMIPLHTLQEIVKDMIQLEHPLALA